MELKIDRSNWKKVKLGDVAFEYSRRINNPSESEFDRFVGSSNIDQWDFHVKSWESKDSVTSAMKLFEPNDYLFVRRSLYASDFRERAPRANFHGVCSGDILTIKENSKEVVDGFLIGVFNSPALWNYVVANASGSITRRIKWRDLANYEFLLPPKDQQAQLAQLLWAMDEVIERERELLERLRNTSQVFFENEIVKSKGKKMPLSRVLIPKKSKSQVPHAIKKYIGLEHIESGSFRCTQYGDSAEVIAQCNIIDEGDLCYSKLRPYLDKAFIAEFKSVSTTELLVYNTEKVSKEYVLNHFHSRPFIHYVTGRGFGTKMPRVSDKIIGEFQIKVLDYENELLRKMRYFHTNADNLTSKISSSKALQKSLINQIF